MEAKNRGQKNIPPSKKKFRLKWTKPLHDCFVKAVNQLGGAYEATPKDIVRIMGIKEITTDHIKSYLQKYRLSEATWNVSRKLSEPIQEREHIKNVTGKTNEASRYIQGAKGNSLLFEGQTNLYKESETTLQLASNLAPVNAPETTKTQQFLQDMNHQTTKHNDQPPNYPSRSWLTLYQESSDINHDVRRPNAAAAAADYPSVNKIDNKNKSAWLLPVKSSEGDDKGLPFWPLTSMGDGIFAGSSMTKQYQSYDHDFTSSNTALQGGMYTCKERKLAANYEPIDLNVPPDKDI